MSKKLFFKIRFQCLQGLAYLLAAFFPAFAESTAYFQHISTEQGLAQNTVYAILRDHTGYMWFATDNGLSRYDGYQFFTYQNDPKRAGSLSANRVKALYEDSKQNLWVGTRNGLNRFDRKHDTFIRYQHNPAISNSLSNNIVQAIIEDDQGYLWIGTKDGLNRFNPDTETFSLYKLNPDIYSDIKQSFTRLARDNSGFLWAATDGWGLIRFTPDWGKRNIRHYYHDKFSSGTLPSNHILSLLIDRQERIWLGGDIGFGRLDDEREFFSNYQDFFDTLEVKPTLLTALYQDDTGTIWAGARRQGLYAINPVSRQITPFFHDAANSRGLNDDEVLSVYQDRSGPLWIGTGRGGVNLYFRQANQFQSLRYDSKNPNKSLSHPVVLSVWETRDRKVWIGTRNGLNRYDPDTGNIHQYFANDSGTLDGLSDNRITALYQDQANILWVGTGDRVLHRFDTSKESWKRYGFATKQDERDGRFDTSEESSTQYRFATVQDVIDGRTIEILIARDGELFVLTNQQLFQLNNTTGQLNKTDGTLHHFDTSEEIWIRYRFAVDDPGGIIDILITYDGELLALTKQQLFQLDTATGQLVEKELKFNNPAHETIEPMSLLYEDRRGNLWIGSRGQGIVSVKDGQATRYLHEPGNPNSLSHNEVHDIKQDANDRLWMATFGGGLNQFDYETQIFSRHTPKSGEIETLLHNVLPDSRGQLWLGDDEAINSFTLTEQKTVKRFDATNGLQTGPKEVAHKGSSGIFYFGGSGGLDFFNPNDFKDNNYTPLPVITRLHTSEKIIEVGLRQLKEVLLPVGESSFQVEFSAMSFWQPEKNRYQCKLEGVDTQPRLLNTDHIVTYNNLSPGSYLLRMRAANNDGKWSESEASLLITITPLFWVTPMAYLMYAAVIFIIMGYVIYNERRRSEFQRRELHWREDYNNQLRLEIAERTRALNQSKNELLQAKYNVENIRHLTEKPEMALRFYTELASHSDNLTKLGLRLNRVGSSGLAVLSLVGIVNEECSLSERIDYALERLEQCKDYDLQSECIALLVNLKHYSSVNTLEDFTKLTLYEMSSTTTWLSDGRQILEYFHQIINDFDNYRALNNISSRRNFLATKRDLVSSLNFHNLSNYWASIAIELREIWKNIIQSEYNQAKELLTLIIEKPPQTFNIGQQTFSLSIINSSYETVAQNITLIFKDNSNEKLKWKKTHFTFNLIEPRQSIDIELNFICYEAGNYQLSGTLNATDLSGNPANSEFIFNFNIAEIQANYHPPDIAPYITGEGVGSDNAFVGRAALFHTLKAYWRQPHGKPATIIMGQRRMGKTSLLNKLERNRLEELNLLPVRVDVSGCQKNNIVNPHSLFTEAGQKMARLLGQPDPVLTVDDPYSGFKALLHDLKPHLDERRFLLMLDEADLLPSTSLSEDLPGFLRTLMQDHGYPVLLLFCGTHRLKERSREYSSILFNTAQTYAVTYMNEAESFQVLREPARGIMEFDDSVLRAAYQLTNGQPFLLQLLGATLITQFNTAYFNDEPRSQFVSLNDLNRAADALVQQGNPAFENHWQDSDTETRYVLSALAQATENAPQTSVDGVAAVMRDTRLDLPRNDTLHILERLVSEEHLTLVGDRLTYRYTVLLYRRWVMWHWPPRKMREERLDGESFAEMRRL